MLPPVLVTAPTETPVSVAELKAHVRVDGDDDDATLTAFIAAAVGYLDGYSGQLGRCMVTQTWRQDYMAWSGALRLPFPDIQSVTVKYWDADNLEQTVSSAEYELVNTHIGVCARFLDAFTWPALNADKAAPVGVTIVTGYGNAAAVPEGLKVAIKQLAAHWFENREATGGGAARPFGFDALVSGFRRRVL